MYLAKCTLTICQSIPKSSHPPYLLLWLALTNWNHQFLVLSRWQGDNQQPAAIVSPVCSLTMPEPITRIGWQRGAFTTSPKVPAPCSCMLPTNGPRPSPPTFGHKHSNMPRMFEMLFQEKGKHSLPSHCSPTQQLSQTLNISILSGSLFTSSKRLFKPVPHFPNGTNNLECVSSSATHLTMPLRYH